MKPKRKSRSQGRKLFRSSGEPEIKRLDVEALESRILYSAAPVEAPAEAEAATEAPAHAAPSVAAAPAPAAAQEAAPQAQAPQAVPANDGETSIPADQGVTIVNVDAPVADITQEQVEEVAAAARQRWIDSGISDEQVAALDQISYRIGELEGGIVGAAEGSVVTVDTDAGGRGWFVDPTPGDDVEFSPGNGGVLVGNIGTDASSKIDLLSVLLHEQGHVMGIVHETEDLALMDDAIVSGGRLLPAVGDADGAVPGSIAGTEHAVTITAGDLVVMAYNSDGTDDVALLALADIPAGSTIFLTDRGWEGSALRTASTFETTVTWTTNAISAGEIVRISLNPAGTDATFIGGTTFGTLSGKISLDTVSGDQLLIYQTADNNLNSSPTFISAFNGNDEGAIGTDVSPADGWEDSGVGASTSNSKSQLPFGLDAANTALGLAGQHANGERDNYVYSGPTTAADKATWLTRWINPTNWTSDNGAIGDQSFDLTTAQGSLPAPGNTLPVLTVAATEETGISISGTDLVITDILGGDTDDDFTISTTATTLTIVDNNGNGIDLGTVTGTGDGTDTVTIDYTEWGGNIIFDALGGDDLLTVDFSSGNFAREITFNGGAQTTTPNGDRLALTGGGTFAQATFDYTNANDGSIDITGNSTINYTGLEPITSTITATNVFLDFTSTSNETITVTDNGASITVDSTAGELTTFNKPTDSLRIDATAGADTISFTNALALGAADFLVNPASSGSILIGHDITTTGDLDFAGPVVLSGTPVLSGTAVTFRERVNGGADLTVNASGATTFRDTVGASTALTSLTTNAGGTTYLDAAVTTAGGATFHDNVELTNQVTITNTGAGGVAFNGTVDNIAGSSQAHALEIDASGTGTVSFAGAVGSNALLSRLAIDSKAAFTLASDVTVHGDVTVGAASIAIQADILSLHGDVDLDAAGSVSVSSSASIGDPAVLSGFDLFVEDFETFGQRTTNSVANVVLVNDWSNQANGVIDDLDWTSDRGGTSSGTTGPSTDHTLGTSAGTYLYAEASGAGSPSKLANLISPIVNLEGSASSMLEFYYHMLGTGMGTLEVQGSSDGGATWSGNLFSVSGNQGSAWNQAIVDLSSFDGESNVRLRFQTTTGSSFSSDIAIDDVRIFGDVTPLTGTVSIAAGTTATIGGDLNGRKVDVIANGNVTVSGTASITQEGTATGDEELVLSQNFEGFGQGSTSPGASVTLTEGWSNQANGTVDDLDWTSDRNGTPSGGTGPTVDNTLGNSAGTYLYVETSGSASPNKVAHLHSPAFDLSAADDSHAEFAYHMSGANMGTLSVQASTDGGTSWSGDLFVAAGHQGNVWKQAAVDLSAFAGESTVMLRFLAISGNGFASDIAIDDVRIYQQQDDDGVVIGSGTGTITIAGSVIAEDDISIGEPAAVTLLTQDFEAFPDGPDGARATVVLPVGEGWLNVVNGSGDELDWSPDRGGTPSGGTGPSVDHTLGTAAGTYLYVETSDPVLEDETALLLSPNIDFSDVVGFAGVEFYYHMLGPHMGTVNVQASTDGGASWSTDLFSVSGNQGNTWHKAEVDLSAFIGSSQLMLRVEGIAGPVSGIGGAGYQSDFAIDDFHFVGGNYADSVVISGSVDGQGDVIISAVNNVTISDVDAGGDTTITSIEGDISDLGVSPDISANSVTYNGSVTPGLAGTGRLELEGNLHLASDDSVTVEVGGVTPGTQHDQLAVNGDVNLGSSALAVDLGGYTPSGSESFVILDKTSAGAINGFFVDSDTGSTLGEGAVLTANGYVFTISYVGGDGNDVVLNSLGPAETGVELNGSTLEVRDINGGTSDDDLRISVDNGTGRLVIEDPTNIITTSVAGAVRPSAYRVEIPLSAFTDLDIETLAGMDLVTFNSITGITGGIDTDGGTDFDTITYNAVSGSGELTGTSAYTAVAEHISHTAGSRLGTDSGTITLRGTGGGASLSGSGVLLRAAALASTSGNVVIEGEGGDTGTGNAGVALYEAGTASSITTGGTIDITGTGGGAGYYAHGVEINQSTITSTSGAVTAIRIDGTGGSFVGGDYSNIGVNGYYATITATGGIDLDGTGGTGSTDYHNGIYLLASTVTGATLDLTGIAGDGNSGSYNRGIFIGSGSDLDANVGNATLTGTGGSAGYYNDGVYIVGSSVDANDILTIDGTATSKGTNVGFSSGTHIYSSTTTGGAGLDIDGVGGTGSGGYSYGVNIYSSTATGGSGATTIDGTAQSTTNGYYNVGASVQYSTVSGTTLDIVGTGGGGTWYNRGVHTAGGSLTSTGGALDIDGTNANNHSGGYNDGVLMQGTTTTATGGMLTIDGTGSLGPANSTGNNGVNIYGGTADGDGGVEINGTGGAGFGGYNFGTYLYYVTSIDGGSNGVKITGTGNTGASTNGYSNVGAGVQYSTVTGSTIEIDGTGGRGTYSNRGVLLTAGSLTASATGGDGIKITGDTSNLTAGGGNDGVQISGTSLTAANSRIVIDGDGSTDTTNLSYNNGVYLSSATLNSEDLSINGDGGAGTGYNSGVYVFGGSITTTGTADTVIRGNGGTGAGGYNYGVYIYSATIAANNSTLDIDGTASSSATGTNNTGVGLQYSTLSGNIVDITGNGGGGTDYNRGIYMVGGSIAADNGNAAISGFANANTAGAYNEGINASGASITSSNGRVTILGVCNTSTGNSYGNHGVYLSSVTANGANGTLVIGTGGRGSGGYNTGVTAYYSNIGIGTSFTEIRGKAAAGTGGAFNEGVSLQYSTVIGSTLTVNGTGGGGTNNNRGIYLVGGSATSLGVTTFNGQTAGATGSNNHGVDIYGATIGGTTSTSITGTGGASGLDYNHGIMMYSITTFGVTPFGTTPTAGGGTNSEAEFGDFFPQ